MNVELKYQGPNQGAFAVFSLETGNRYDIAGRGDQFWVDERDVAWLTTPTRYGEEYVRIERQRVLPPDPVLLPTIDFGALNVAETVIPAISTMTARKAVRAIADIDNAVDLRVVEAVEHGSQNRPEVIEAIAKRRAELADHV